MSNPRGREMMNLRPYFVSLVDRAANRREFLTRKDADGGSETLVQVPFIKRDDIAAEEGARFVTGVVYEPGVEDTQGDHMTAVEIEKAAHLYMRNYQGVDIQHSFQPAEGCYVAESTVHKADTVIGGQKVPAGAWTLTVGIEDPAIVAKVDRGELNGFSVGGLACYPTAKADDPSIDEGGRSLAQKVVTWLRQMFKLDSADGETSLQSQHNAGQPTQPNGTGKSEAPKPEPNKAPESTEAGHSPAGATPLKQDEGGSKMSLTTEDVAAIVNGVAAKLQPVQKSAEPEPEAKPEVVTKSEVQAMITEAVAKALQEKKPDAAPEETTAKTEEFSDDEKAAAIIAKAAAGQVLAAVDKKMDQLGANVDLIMKAYAIKTPTNANGTPAAAPSGGHYMDSIFGM